METSGIRALLLQFKQKYPILFECLEAIFGAMMSNSQLCEQIHGMMHHGLCALVGMEQSDHQRAYNISTGYKMNEECRLQKTTTSSTGEFKE